MPLEFISLPDDRIEEAFDVLRRTAQWLRQTDKHQRVGKTTLETYHQWQSEGANFCVIERESDSIICVATLRKEQLFDWPRFSQQGEVLMLRSVTTAPEHRGKRAGEFAIQNVIETARGNVIYLDCVVGFLPGYYAQFGFEQVDRQLLEHHGEAPYDVLLMRRAG